MIFRLTSRVEWIGNVCETHVLFNSNCLCVNSVGTDTVESWWRHQMEAFSALLAIFAGNSPVTGEFPAQRPVTRSFDVFFDLRPNKRLSKQWWGWWFETPAGPFWRHCNGAVITLSDLSPYCIRHCDDSGRTCIRFQPRKGTPHRALTGELWGVYCEDLGENWPRYNDTAL